MEPRDAQLLEHILDYCEDVEKAVERFGCSFDSFRTDRDYRDVIAFRVLQIGELSGKLSPELRSGTENRIEWHKIRGMRNIVAHNYGLIRLDILWEVVMHDIPILRDFCEEQLEEENA